MRKKILFFVFLGLFIFLSVDKDLKAANDESTISILWHQADGLLKKQNVTRYANKSVCSLSFGLNTTDYNFCQPRANEDRSKYDVYMYPGSGANWEKIDTCGMNEACVNSGAIDDKNGTAECKAITDLPVCDAKGYDFNKHSVRLGEWGCVSSTTFGRCDIGNNFVCQQTCPDQQVCTISRSDLGAYWERVFYKCEDMNCKDQGLLDGQSKCGYAKSDGRHTVVKCISGQTKTEICSKDDQCYEWRDKRAECLSAINDKCISLPPPNDSESIGPYAKTFVTCKGNQIISCDNPPTITLGENCDDKPGTKCYVYPDKNEAECKTPKEIGDYESSIKITTTTSDAFWCEEGISINTAIGCIPITISGENGLVAKLLPTIFGIAGGIAFLMMVYGFIMISTSSGDEKKVQAAKQIVTSAIIGLLVSVFALFLYRLIAVQILHIPGI